MKVVGLITEYNPFHNGHLYHIQEAKKVTGADYIVVVMSGNFLQRGVPALLDKYTRTRMALLKSADLVLELPVCFATGSAEYFAAGAVSILNRLNVVDYICFGSECGDVKLLTDIAGILANEPVFFSENLKVYLKKGLTYPRARTKALLDYLQNNNIDNFDINYLNEVLSSPNNILGIEYIKALIKSNSSIKPLTITRKVSGYHDENLEHDISSATAIRLSLMKGNSMKSLKANLPKDIYEIMQNDFLKSFPVFDDDFSLLLRYKLMTESNLTLSKYVDVSGGLDMRIYNHLNKFTSFSKFAELVKSKQITLTRVNRALIHIILNIYVSDFNLFIENGYSQYLRILGFRKESSELLRIIKNSTEFPVITKVSDAKYNLTDLGMIMLNQDIIASDIYNLIVFDKYTFVIKNDFIHEVVIV